MENGDNVLVSQDLTRSFDRHGPADEMYDMKGRIFQLEHVYRDSVVIRFRGHSFTFAKCDVQLIDETDRKPLKTKDPEVFDPQHLDLE